jgi:hypothetical protein
MPLSERVEDKDIVLSIPDCMEAARIMLDPIEAHWLRARLSQIGKCDQEFRLIRTPVQR